ncbi:unnamed protein product [Peronospora belbahrii]|uniref:pectinesterase n=1 Tax=Peronospora belbahrii TaxID=622444 RepID=A0ABN8D1A3_9STRA|nr:unnamed protein product [Peronospora belbahrii]
MKTRSTLGCGFMFFLRLAISSTNPAFLKHPLSPLRQHNLRLKSGSGVKVYNINVVNPSGDIEELAKGPAIYLDDSNGAGNFVIGKDAKAWFESCDIDSIEKGWITANGNKNCSNSSTFVFNHANVFGCSGVHTTYLRRPWSPYARVVWQNSELSDVVNPAGWDTWNGDTDTSRLYFKEYCNSGLGADTSMRAKFSDLLSGPVDITEILGQDNKSMWWFDSTFL